MSAMSVRDGNATRGGEFTRLERCLILVAIILSVPRMAGADPTDVRQFLDRATTMYGAPPVALVTLTSDRGRAAYYRAGKIYLCPWVYESPLRFEIAAHEFGHHLQGPPALSRFSPKRSVRQAEQYGRELDANVRAVDILICVDGISELDAVTRVHGLLVAMSTMQLQEHTLPRFGHKDRCVEAADLLARFPQYRAHVTQPCPAETRMP
jgi:hypothetical protein